MKSLFEGDEKFKLTDEGNIDKYLSADAKPLDDGSYELRQPFLIRKIINELNLSSVETQKQPALVAKLSLHEDLQGKPRVKR